MASPVNPLSDLWKIRDSFTDVTLRCEDGKTLRAHKIILSAASTTLHGVCTIGDEVSLTNFNLAAVERLVKYLYTGQRPTDEDDDEVLRREFAQLAALVGVKEPGSVDQSKNKRRQPLDASLEQPESKKHKEDLDPMSNSTHLRSDADQINEASPAPKTPTNITDLPDELLVKIFTYVRTSDLLQNVAKVSKRFNRLSQDPGAHVSVQLLHCSDRNSRQVTKFLKGKNQIEKVALRCESDFLLTFDLAVMKQKKTRSVAVYSPNLSVVVEQLATNPNKARQIQELRIWLGETQLPKVTPELKNLIELSLMLGIRDIVSETKRSLSEFSVAIAAQSEKLETIRLYVEMDEDHLAMFLDRHGKRLKKIWMLATRLTDAIVSESIIAGNNLKKLEELDIDGSPLSVDSVVQISRLENLKRVKMIINFNADLVTQLLTRLDIGRFDYFKLWGSHGRFEWEGGTETKFKLENSDTPDSIDLTQTLKLPELASVTTVDIIRGHLDDVRIFDRFQNLSQLTLQVQRDRFSVDDMLTLLSIAKEKRLKSLTIRFPRSFTFFRLTDPNPYIELQLTDSCTKVSFRAESSSLLGVKAQAVLESLASLSLEKIEVKFDGPLNKGAEALARKMPNLRELHLELPYFTTTAVVSMLKFATDRQLQALKLVSIQRSVYWELTDLSHFNVNLGEKLLKAKDLEMMLATLQRGKLTRLSLAFGGILEPSMIKLIDNIENLKYLYLKNDNLLRVPRFLHLDNLEALVLDNDVTGENSDESETKDYDDSSDDGDSENLVTEADVRNLATLRKLKYLQTSRILTAHKDVFNFFDKYGRPDVWVLKNALVAVPSVTLKDILETFSDSQHLETLNPSNFRIFN